MTRVQRQILTTSVLLLVSLPHQACFPAASGRQPQSRHPVSADGSGGLQFLDVNDPVYGVPMGKLPFFAGWQGTVGVTRADAGCLDCNSVSLNLTSADGRSQIQTYGEALRTGLYAVPGQKGHYLQMRFTSTADLLVHDILPSLNLQGRVSVPRPSLGRQGAAALADMKRLPVASNPFAQGAAVTISGGPAGRDYVVEALTLGGSLGTSVESSATHFTIIQAPAGQADSLARRWEELAPLTINPEWQQRNDDHTMAVLKRMEQEGRQQTAQVQQWMRDYNTRQAQFNKTQMDSNKAARDAQQGRANQSLYNSQQNQRGITDTGNQVIDSRNGNSRYYTFCNNATGQVAYQYNNTAPPDASGQWRRCGQ